MTHSAWPQATGREFSRHRDAVSAATSAAYSDSQPLPPCRTPSVAATCPGPATIQTTSFSVLRRLPTRGDTDVHLTYPPFLVQS